MPHRLAALVLAAALALTGCADDPEPKVAPSETPAPSKAVATATIGSTPPVQPLAATRKSASGARAFTEHWVSLVNHAQATGDTQELAKATDPRCIACRGLTEAIEETYGGGGRISGGEWSIDRLRQLPLDHGADWAGFANGRTQRQVVRNGDGTTDTYPPGSFDFYAYIAWTNDGWIMRWLRTPY